MRESDSTSLSIATAEEMHELGGQLGAVLSSTTGAIVVTFGGELGAGKTTLVRGLLRTLGIDGTIRSPTYTLVEPYDSGERAIYHLDLYRVNDPSEIEDLGLRDLLEGDALLLIEWAEKGAGAVPLADLHIQISYSAAADDQTRRVSLIASTVLGISLLTRFDSVKHQQYPLSS